MTNPADYIVPLNINGLDGRMLMAPSRYKKRQREILLLYGHHALLERWWGLVQNLQDYGNVTMPDVPGFGGMDSFYKIGIKPSTDAYADYLAAFVKLRYKRKRVTIFAISYGFVIVTRMLQRYPELANKVDLLVSVVGFTHHDDFLYTPRQKRLYRRATRLFATKPFAFFIRYFALNRFILKTLYVRLPNSKRRMIEVSPEEFEATMDFEVKIWQANDVRTHWLTTSQFFTLDNCQVQVNLPVAHVVSEHDHYFDNGVVEQHMKVIFKDYTQHMAQSKAHTPSVLADKKAMAILVPPALRRILAKS
jgi:pimeloyl-ACP methyl ester carboxylesterase